MSTPPLEVFDKAVEPADAVVLKTLVFFQLFDAFFKRIDGGTQSFPIQRHETFLWRLIRGLFGRRCGERGRLRLGGGRLKRLFEGLQALIRIVGIIGENRKGKSKNCESDRENKFPNRRFHEPEYSIR